MPPKKKDKGKKGGAPEAVPDPCPVPSWPAADDQESLLALIAEADTTAPLAVLLEDASAEGEEAEAEAAEGAAAKIAVRWISPAELGHRDEAEPVEGEVPAEPPAEGEAPPAPPPPPTPVVVFLPEQPPKPVDSEADVAAAALAAQLGAAGAADADAEVNAVNAAAKDKKGKDKKDKGRKSKSPGGKGKKGRKSKSPGGDEDQAAVPGGMYCRTLSCEWAPDWGLKVHGVSTPVDAPEPEAIPGAAAAAAHA